MWQALRPDTVSSGVSSRSSSARKRFAPDGAGERAAAGRGLTAAGLMREAVTRSICCAPSTPPRRADCWPGPVSDRSEAMVRYPVRADQPALCVRTLRCWPTPRCCISCRSRRQFDFVPPCWAVFSASTRPPSICGMPQESAPSRCSWALPDGLDLMVICAEAGLSLDATLSPRVARARQRPGPSSPRNSASPPPS